jgi:hypothetical protein
MPLMPCFSPDQAANEGIIIGRILAGYGELETTVLACLVAVEGQVDYPIRHLFKRTAAENRLKLARNALLPDYIKAGLEGEMTEALNNIDWCRKLRNQYAHCQWGWTTTDGLFFVNLEDLADQLDPIRKVMAHSLPVDVQLLEEQEAYCNYVRESFMHLETAYLARHRAGPGVRQPTHFFAKPLGKTRPPMHNPPLK